MTARLVEDACFVVRPSPKTIRGTITTPPPTPTRPDKDTGQEHQGDRDLLAFTLGGDTATASSRVSEGQKNPCEGDLHHRRGRDTADVDPDQGGRRHRRGEERRRPPVCRVLASGAANRTRKGAEDDDHEARRNGFFNIPPCHVHERRYENDTSPNPDDPRKNPAESPQNRQDKKLKNFLHRAILADKGYRQEECFRAPLNPRRRPRRAPAQKEVDSPRENPPGDRVIQIVKAGSEPAPVPAQVVAEVGKGEDPRHAPNKSVEGELGEVHSGSPGGKGDKRTHHG